MIQSVPCPNSLEVGTAMVSLMSLIVGPDRALLMMMTFLATSASRDAFETLIVFFFFKDSLQFSSRHCSASKCSLDFCICPLIPLLSWRTACAVLEISLPKSSSCISPSLCISIFRHNILLKTLSSSSMLGLQPFICGVHVSLEASSESVSGQ